MNVENEAAPASPHVSNDLVARFLAAAARVRARCERAYVESDEIHVQMCLNEAIQLWWAPGGPNFSYRLEHLIWEGDLIDLLDAPVEISVPVEEAERFVRYVESVKRVSRASYRRWEPTSYES